MSQTVIIRKCPKLGLCIYIDNKNHEQFLTYHERVQCLKIANERFDRQIDEVAHTFSDHPYGKYLWVYTAEFIRTEQIEGLLRQHYLTAILELLMRRHQKVSVIVESIIPTTLLASVRVNCFQVRLSTASYYWSSIKFYGSRLAIVFRKTFKNFGYVLRRQNPPHSGALIDIFRDIRLQRFDNISAVTELYPSHRFYSGQEEKIKGIPVEKIVDFRRELKLTAFFGTIAKTIKVAGFILKNRNRIPAELFNNLSNLINLLMYFDLLIYEHCVERYFSKNHITRLIHVSTLAKPAHRILMSSAGNHGAKVILVASRSLARFVPADRLLQSDVNEVNQVKLPDHFILKDHYSLKAFEQYPQLKRSSAVGARFINKRYNSTGNNDQPVALYIMLNYRFFLCIALLEEIRKAVQMIDVPVIIYRSHPLCYINPDLVQGYFPRAEIIDNSGKDYTILHHYRTIVLAGPSTGALELADTGAVILWVSYIWDNSIIMDDLMQKVGLNCTCQQSLSRQLKVMAENTGEYSQQVKADAEFVDKHFKTNALISDKLKEFELEMGKHVS